MTQPGFPHRHSRPSTLIQARAAGTHANHSAARTAQPFPGRREAPTRCPTAIEPKRQERTAREPSGGASTGMVENADADASARHQKDRQQPTRGSAPQRRVPHRGERAMLQHAGRRRERRPQPPRIEPVDQPRQIDRDRQELRSPEREVPGQKIVLRADREIIHQQDRQRDRKQEWLQEPADATGEPNARTRPARQRSCERRSESRCAPGRTAKPGKARNRR